NLLSVALLVGSKASVIQYAPPPSHSLFGHAVFWWEVHVKSSESTVSILALPFSATPALLASASRADIPVLSTEVLWAASQSCPLPAGETAGNFFLHFFQSIIYVRDYNSRHQEVSAYIDYAYRLTTDDFEAYFSGKKRLLPRKTDLSFYNWNKNVVSSNPSPNYEVIAENSCGLLFKNKMDGKIINVNPKVYPGDNTTRTPVKTNLYLHMVIYDHIVGREP
uniref:Cilia- and flagella-associated protein 299 n=1 Tax=Anas zonorhyncha TaxID=75864 RepID=A0A8B9U530_9AVES